MKKSFRLSIPEPCHEKWDNMTPVDKGRFCGSCQKQVVDFTNMSDAQLIAFFKKPATGSVCGRLFTDQLGRDIQLPRKRIPWIKYFFQFLIPAFFASSKVVAQGGVIRIKPHTVILPDSLAPKPIVQDKLIVQSRVLQGTIRNAKGDVLSYATVVIKGTTIAVSSKIDGTYQLPYDLPQKKIVLIASMVGYDYQEMLVDVELPNLQIDFQLKQRTWEGNIVVGETRRVPEEKKKTKKVEKCEIAADTVAINKSALKAVRDGLFKKIRIYPNPVMPGTSLHIEWKKMQEGYYVLELIAQSGASIYQRELWVDENARLLNLEVPNVAAGTYLLRVKSKDSGLGFSEVVIIR